jgi:hypothetical protein
MLISRDIYFENASFAIFPSMPKTSFGDQRIAFATDPLAKHSFGDQRKNVNLEEQYQGTAYKNL